MPCRGVGRSNAGVGGLVRDDGGVYGGGVGRDSSERTIHKGPEGVGEEIEPQLCRRRAGTPPPPPRLSLENIISNTIRLNLQLFIPRCSPAQGHLSSASFVAKLPRVVPIRIASFRVRVQEWHPQPNINFHQEVGTGGEEGEGGPYASLQHCRTRNL